ncbi:MAG TPA: phosphatase PAP2 family protein [Candidatus Saccharimonadales bacterium]
MKPKTDTTPYKGHFAFYVSALIVSLLVFVTGAAVAYHKTIVTGWEQSLFLSVNGWPEGLYKPMMFATFFGTAWAAATSVAAAFFARYYKLAGRLALSILAGYGLTVVFKGLVGRDRPEGLIDGTILRTIEPAMGYPSTHTAIATIIFLTLLPYLKWRWRWIVPLIVAVVAVSRVYLGAHLPLDVLGGAAIGTAIVAFVRVLPQPLRIMLRID